MYAPTAVPLAATQLAVGADVVPQQIPRAIIAETPTELNVAPSVAVVVVIAEETGVTTVGVVKVVNVPSAEYAVPAALVAYPL